MNTPRITLWRRMLNESLDWSDDEVDFEFTEELRAQEDHVQCVYEELVPVLGQFGQIEEGLIAILRADLERRGLDEAQARARSDVLTFGRSIKCVEQLLSREGLAVQFEEQIHCLRKAKDARNRLTHGRIHVGVARNWGTDSIEPVLVLVFYGESADELDVRKDMARTEAAMTAMIEIMVGLRLPWK